MRTRAGRGCRAITATDLLWRDAVWNVFAITVRICVRERVLLKPLNDRVSISKGVKFNQGDLKIDWQLRRSGILLQDI